MENSSNGRGDAVRRERMLSLKRSRAVHLGYLNRLYKDVELLMQNADNYHVACKKKKDVDIAFARCFQAYDEYYQFAIDPEVKLDALNACHSIMTGKKEFDEHFEEWSRSVQRTVDNTSVVPRQDYGDTAESQIVTRSVVTSSSRNSKSSKSSSRASDRSKKAKAELLRREVELKNLLKRQEMERQMERQIAEMKIQEDELKRRIALLTAEGEIEKAKAVDELYETSEYSKRGTEAELKPVYKDETRDSLPPVKDLQVGPNFKSGDFKQVGRNYSKSVLNPGAQPWDLGPPQNTIGAGDPTGSQQLQEILTQQQEALQLMAYTIRHGFEMPKRELLTFDGNPLNYWLFTNNFEVNIAKRVPDPETRLTYLIQHCTGKAREAIKNCAIMSDPEQGYRKAQEILYHRFGQKHIIAHAHITKIVEGPQIKNTDSTGLLDLSVEMQNCALTLAQMGYEADVNNSDNLVKVVKRLPVHLQSKWADRAGS